MNEKNKQTKETNMDTHFFFTHTIHTHTQPLSSATTVTLNSIFYQYSVDEAGIKKSDKKTITFLFIFSLEKEKKKKKAAVIKIYDLKAVVVCVEAITTEPRRVPRQQQGT